MFAYFVVNAFFRCDVKVKRLRLISTVAYILRAYGREFNWLYVRK